MKSATPAPMTRRSILGTLATGAALAVAGSAGAASPEGTTSMRISDTSETMMPRASNLSDLIADHRAAWQRVHDAGQWHDDIEEKYSRRELERDELLHVPLGLSPRGNRDGGYMIYDADLLRQDFAASVSEAAAAHRSGIIARHDELRAVHCSKWSRKMLPKAVRVEAEISASEARAIEKLAAAIDHFEELRLESGITACHKELDEAYAHERRARLALVIYSPRDAAETTQRAEYVRASEAFSEHWCHESSFVEVFLTHFGITIEQAPDDEQIAA